MGRGIRGPGIHRPQFVTGKQPPAPADADLRKDRGTRSLNPNRDYDNDEYRPTYQKKQDTGYDVERSLHLSIAPMSANRGLHHSAKPGFGVNLRRPAGLLQIGRT